MERYLLLKAEMIGLYFILGGFYGGLFLTEISILCFKGNLTASAKHVLGK